MKKNKIIAMLVALFGLIGLTNFAAETKANTTETILLTDYFDSLGVPYYVDINWAIGDSGKEYLIFIFEDDDGETIDVGLENIKVFGYNYADKDYDEYNSFELFDANVTGNMWYYGWVGAYKLIIYNDYEIYDINNI